MICFSLQGFERVGEMYSFRFLVDPCSLVAVAIELYSDNSTALVPPADLFADILQDCAAGRLTCGRRVGDGCDCAALWCPLCPASC